jgi:HAD superfamily hydrolase (TIGR01509 family)
VAPPTADALGAAWRLALAAAHDALAASSGCPTPTLGDAELRARTRRLAQERDEVEALLEAEARLRHVSLVRRLTLPTATRAELGLPRDVDACLFDLDGVLAASADAHFAAWAETFDALLARRLAAASVHLCHYARFSRRADYDDHVAGKPRLEGARAFLASRGIALPDGRPDDPPGAETVHGFANGKNAALRRRLAHEGVAAYAGARRYLDAAAAAGLPCAVVSPSANTGAILERAGLADLVDVVVDGRTMAELGLRAKPAADALVAACERLGVATEHAAAFETTAAGIAAARAAAIRLVVLVTRDGAAPAAGWTPDLAVGDLAELLRPRLRRAA